MTERQKAVPKPSDLTRQTSNPVAENDRLESSRIDAANYKKFISEVNRSKDRELSLNISR